jgi:plastocyanin
MKMKMARLKMLNAVLLLIGCGILLAACGPAIKDAGDPLLRQTESRKETAVPDDPGGKEVRIAIENFVFAPSEITIAPGTKVTWVNKDEAPHTATSVDKKFNSGGLDTGDTFTFVFNEKGEYPYFCALHPHMKATITVK